MRSRFVFGGVVSLLIAAVLALVVFAISVLTRAATASGGLTTQDLSAVTAQDLASALVGGGVSISNVAFTGATDSAGTFTGGTGIIGTETPGSGGIDSGIILSSGNVANVVGPNTSNWTSADNVTPGDSDLTALSGASTFDAAVLEFDFVPDADHVFFQYVFGSEEYNEWVNSEFNDVFGFFVNGVNCATVPGSGGPEPVSVNAINMAIPSGPLPIRTRSFTSTTTSYPGRRSTQSSTD